MSSYRVDPPERTESDSLGDVSLPAGAWYGAQTQRAIDNFPISGIRLPPEFIAALGLVKLAAAEVNAATGRLEPAIAEAIAAAAREVAEGALDDQFPIDVFQTGSGTSTNMNANEVIANRAIASLGGVVGSRTPVHPNDHVNLGQSSNDVIPTAIHVAAATAIERDLLPSLRRLHAALAHKAGQFDGIVKSGRTHLMDATPVRLGQEFAGYAAQLDGSIRRAEAARDALLPLALGGTATGTGLNRPASFPGQAIARIAVSTGLPFREAPDHFAAQGAQDAVVEASGHTRTIAASFTKIANDIRWMGSGPRAGLAELRLPSLAPGSSIMPGKVNPIMSEMLTMVAARVMGNDAAIGIAGASGSFELNTFLPLLAADLLQSIRLLAAGARTFSERCVEGLSADEERCRESVERNLALSTALAPVVGYDAAAEISKDAASSGRTVREVALERAILTADQLDAVLDARAMTEPDPD